MIEFKALFVRFRTDNVPQEPPSSLASAMDADLQRQLIHDILHPENVNTQDILEDLGVGSVPTREQIHREIEEKLLLPQDRLPSHWLPSHQMWVPTISGL